MNLEFGLFTLALTPEVIVPFMAGFLARNGLLKPAADLAEVPFPRARGYERSLIRGTAHLAVRTVTGIATATIGMDFLKSQIDLLSHGIGKFISQVYLPQFARELADIKNVGEALKTIQSVMPIAIAGLTAYTFPTAGLDIVTRIRNIPCRIKKLKSGNGTVFANVPFDRISFYRGTMESQELQWTYNHYFGAVKDILTDSTTAKDDPKMGFYAFKERLRRLRLLSIPPEMIERIFSDLSRQGSMDGPAYYNEFKRDSSYAAYFRSSSFQEMRNSNSWRERMWDTAPVEEKKKKTKKKKSKFKGKREFP